jgi:hypothetical protein
MIVEFFLLELLKVLFMKTLWLAEDLYLSDIMMNGQTGRRTDRQT